MAAAIHVTRVRGIVFDEETKTACVQVESHGAVIPLYLPECVYREGLQLGNAVMALHDHPVDNVQPLRRKK